MQIPFGRRHFLGGLSVLGAGLASPSWLLAAGPARVEELAQLRSSVREAWIYAYPMLMHYKTMHKQVLDPRAPEYLGGFNRFRHYAQLFTPENRDIVTPNNDTPYSWAWLDLRGEPQVLSVPAVSAGRYYVHQLVDQYTHNFAYVGVLSTGREAGDYLIAGPHWQGETPAGIKQVLRSETELVMILGRTGLQGAADLPAVKALQAQYRLRPLHAYADTPAPAAPATVAWLPWQQARGLGPAFITHLNQLLQFCPPHESELSLRAGFAAIGMRPGQAFDPAALDAARRQALTDGILDAQRLLQAAVASVRSSAGLFGARQALGNDYLKRAVGAATGIYGNSIEEAFYTGARLDQGGQPLLGGQRYVLHFAPGQLPPASAFWSLSLYDLPDRQLVSNPLQRYSLGTYSDLQRDADGGLSLYVQPDLPAAEHASNWLPAPQQGPFSLILRLYGPDPAVLSGQWRMPPVEKL